MPKKRVNPEELFDGTPFGMSQAVIETDSRLVFISGQVDWGTDYTARGDSVASQFDGALKNLEIALKAADCAVDDLLFVRVMIRGELGDHMETAAEKLSGFLGSSRPAVTGIGVASLASPETLVEIEAVARRAA